MVMCQLQVIMHCIGETNLINLRTMLVDCTSLLLINLAIIMIESTKNVALESLKCTSGVRPRTC